MYIPADALRDPPTFEQVTLRRGTGFGIKALVPAGADTTFMSAKEFYEKARHEDWAPRRADKLITFARIKYTREFLEVNEALG